jgi:N-acetylmuramoyl-L-alanine amidase
MRKINKIIIHCTATPKGREVNVATIRKWHVEDNGWQDIGYHFIISLDGEVEEGRPIEKTGAHTYGENWDSIGIAYVGGMNRENTKAEDTRTESQKESLIDLICMLKDSYGGTVYGHRDFSNKECPSFDAKKEYENISNRY